MKRGKPNNNKLIWFAIVIVILATLSFLLGSILVWTSANRIPNRVSGFETTNFVSNPVLSGVNSTSTVVTTYTATSTDLIGYSVITMSPNKGALTLTLPASSTLSSWLGGVGNNTLLTIFNSTTTSAANITLVGNTGSTIINASSSVIIWPQKATEIRVMRIPPQDFLFILVPAS